MFKYALPLVLCMLMLNAKAQKKAVTQKDTLLVYATNTGDVVPKERADYFMIITPPDPNGDSKLFPVFQYYINGKRKLIAASSEKSLSLVLEGPCISFFPNGKRQSNTMYKKGLPTGEAVEYYPNGKLYTIKRYDIPSTPLLIECRDSLGNVLAENGNGKWITYDDEFKNITNNGDILKGIVLINTWESRFYDKPNQNYSGEIVSQPDVLPSYKGRSTEQFNSFLSHNIRYPIYERDNNIMGVVLVSFIIEKDGVITNLKAKGPTAALNMEALRVAKLSSPWIPGMLKGEPVRTMYTVPITFSLSNVGPN